MMATLQRIKTNRARNCWEEQNWLQDGDFHTAVSHCQLTELPGQPGSSFFGRLGACPITLLHRTDSFLSLLSQQVTDGRGFGIVARIYLLGIRCLIKLGCYSLPHAMTSFPVLRVFSVPALVFILCQCDDGSAARIKSLRDEIDQMNQQHFDASQQVKRLQSQIESAKAEKQKIEEQKAQVEKEREEANKKLEQLQRDFDTYKSSYKLSMQKRAPGMKINDFTTPEGKAYRNVVLRELTDSYVNFTHDAGIIKLTAAQLPEPVQALLGFLNARMDHGREVSTLSNRQINMQRRAEQETQLDAADEKIMDLRKRKEKLMTENSALKGRLRDAEYNGGIGTTALNKAIAEIDLAMKHLDAQLLQAEVERHAVRSSRPQLLPER